MQLLSFAASQCWLLLNGDWLLQLQWQQVEEELQTASTSHCCRLRLSDNAGEPPAVHHVLCAETLFALHANGLICILMMCSQLKQQPDFFCFLKTSSTQNLDDEMARSLWLRLLMEVLNGAPVKTANSNQAGTTASSHQNPPATLTRTSSRVQQLRRQSACHH